MKTLTLLLVIMLQTTSVLAAGEPPDARRQAIQAALKNSGTELGSYTISTNKGQARTSVQCIDGYKFAIVAMAGHQASPGAAVDILQIYKNTDDKVIPVEC